jgi:hypothetical protein
VIAVTPAPPPIGRALTTGRPTAQARYFSRADEARAWLAA